MLIFFLLKLHIQVRTSKGFFFFFKRLEENIGFNSIWFWGGRIFVSLLLLLMSKFLRVSICIYYCEVFINYLENRVDTNDIGN